MQQAQTIDHMIDRSSEAGIMTQQTPRWLLLTPFAAITTIGLFTLMMSLISEEFKPQDKIETGVFEINPKVEDIETFIPAAKLDKLVKVITPPPPPKIDRAKADKPSERPIILDGKIPEFTPPVINTAISVITISDRDAQPLVRIPPIMPPKAQTSGHCRVTFDVNPNGQPFNVTATYCTKKVFERNTIKSVQQWKYNPQMVDGRAVARKGVQNKVSYHLTDERGRIIPE